MPSVIVDTSVWRKYLAGVASTRGLGQLLDDDAVLLHPFVLGELTLGGLSDREASLFRRLPEVPVADHAEIIAFVVERRLTRKGIGWVDAHLLASALIADARLWSADRALASAARSLGIAFSD
jgi:predicted nucleic acid-binding protein